MDNYYDTVYRMYDSSDVLYKAHQWFNANYLAGYVLECYCKLVLMISSGQGHVFSYGRDKVRDFGHAVSDLKDEIDLISLEGCEISSYCLDVRDVCSHILENWNPNKRYESNGSILNTKTLAEDIHKEIEVIADMIIKMEIDGVLV